MSELRRPLQLSAQLRTFAAEDPGGWAPMLARARMFDRVGLDRLVVSEHVVLGERLDEYGRPELGGAAGGTQPTGPDGHWLDPLVTLSHVSALTSRVRLATGILLAALRRPAVLAKELATLDVLSGGRLDLGVGVGWQREEYDATGLGFDERGSLLDHSLAVCRELWTNEVASFDSDRLHFERIHQMPKPAQAGGIPIWISGTVNRPAARRLARFGSGWIPWGPAASDLASSVPAMRSLVEAEGADPDSFEIVGSLPAVRSMNGTIDVAATAGGAADLHAGGVTDLRVSFAPADDSEAEGLLSELVQAVDSLAD